MGGQKTMGTIHKEAFDFVKNNYVAMLVISLIIYAFSSVISGIVAAFMMPVMFSTQWATTLGAVSAANDASKALAVIIPIALLVLLMGAVLFVLTLAVQIGEMTATVGAQNATLTLLGGVKPKPTFDVVWKDFSRNWKRYLAVSAWTTLWVFLWGLLFIIPGYIKSLSYRFAPYLMIQYPEMTAKEALRKSMEITDGYRERLFGLDVIIVGYGLAVSLLSCLVVPLLATIFWIPLITYAMGGIAYLDIKQAAIEKGLLPSAVPPQSEA